MTEGREKFVYIPDPLPNPDQEWIAKALLKLEKRLDDLTSNEEAEKEHKRLEDLIKACVPDGDIEAHNHWHTHGIRSSKSRKARNEKILVVMLSCLAIGGLFSILYSVWEALRERLTS